MCLISLVYGSADPADNPLIFECYPRNLRFRKKLQLR